MGLVKCFYESSIEALEISHWLSRTTTIIRPSRCPLKFRRALVSIMTIHIYTHMNLATLTIKCLELMSALALCKQPTNLTFVTFFFLVEF